MNSNQPSELSDLAFSLKNYWLTNGDKKVDSKGTARSWSRKSPESKEKITKSIISLIKVLVRLSKDTVLGEIKSRNYPEISEINLKWNDKSLRIIPFLDIINFLDLEKLILRNSNNNDIFLVISAHPLTKNICVASAKARESGFNVILASPDDIDFLASFDWTLSELIQYKLFRIFLEGGIDADAQYVAWEIEKFRDYLKEKSLESYFHTLTEAIKLHKEKLVDVVLHPKFQLINNIERKKKILFLGKSASGKTTLALSIGEELKQRNVDVYYIDIGLLNSEKTYRVGAIIYNLCINSNKKICIILDDIQTQSGISKNLLEFLGLLNKSFLGNNLYVIALSWPGYVEAVDNSNLKFETIFLEAADIADKMIEKLGSKLSENDKKYIKDQAGEDLLLLKMWLEVSNEKGEVVDANLLAKTIWENRVGRNKKNLASLKRMLLIISTLGLYEIDTPISYLKDFADSKKSDIDQLVRRKLVIKTGERVSPLHRSSARLMVEYLYDDRQTWNWFKNNQKEVQNFDDILLNYIDRLNPNEIWETLETVNLSGGIKTGTKSQNNVKLLIESWKQIDELKKKINSQIEEDPTWRDSLSSSTFAVIGLSTLGVVNEALECTRFIRENYEIVRGKLQVKIRNLSTLGDFEKILERMEQEEKDGTFPVSFELERSDELDVNLFHENWASGIVLVAEAAINELSPKELERLALSVEKRIDPKGYFYPSRVPWCTARVLTGLGQCGRNIENSDVVRKVAKWLLDDRSVGGGREYIYWTPGTDGWNTPEETTAMCIIALRSVGVPSTDSVLNNAMDWLHDQNKIWKHPGFELDRAIAAEAHLSMNRNWEEIRDAILQLATWANNIALWRRATLHSQKTYDQTCKVAQVGAFIIAVMWQKLSEDLPEMLLAIETTLESENREKKSMENKIRKKKYDIAITYSSKNRRYVRRVVDCLIDAGFDVFYDELESAKNLGVNLYDYLDDVYRKKAEYCVMFISEDYAKKAWTTHERQAAQARAFQENRTYILPVRFDNTDIPGIPNTILYLDASKLTTKQVCETIIEKITNSP